MLSTSGSLKGCRRQQHPLKPVQWAPSPPSMLRIRPTIVGPSEAWGQTGKCSQHSMRRRTNPRSDLKHGQWNSMKLQNHNCLPKGATNVGWNERPTTTTTIGGMTSWTMVFYLICDPPGLFDSSASCLSSAAGRTYLLLLVTMFS